MNGSAASEALKESVSFLLMSIPYLAGIHSSSARVDAGALTSRDCVTY
jgi:hypothetical protein